MKNRTIILLSILVVGCGPKMRQTMPTPELRVATAVEQNVPEVYEFTSQTQASRSYIIQPRVNGYLRSIEYSSGLPVKRGQRLFTIDSAPFKTQVAEARASLSSAKSSLVQAQANYQRDVPLAKINAISKSQLDASVASLAAAKEDVASSRAVLDNALLNIEYCVIKAPESGIIDKSKANVGDYVGMGTAYQTLATISFDDSVTVNLSLPTERYYKIASLNEPSYMSDSLLKNITLTLSDGTVYPYWGVYKFTEPEVDDQSGTIVFSVDFPNPKGVLKGGQFARVKAEIGKTTPRVLIPARSVNEIQGVYSTYVVGRGDSLEFRKLSVGEVFDGKQVILSGVKAQERVITEGFAKAKSGMKIKPITK